ncbi:hypothetical protein F4780DRAFT_255065 [Xylariomycetidae sp. FL0641]|nr:hypothetical protein F4780DRAFT_255065 [Xylariomycetidae sp. FL0641]
MEATPEFFPYSFGDDDGDDRTRMFDGPKSVAEDASHPISPPAAYLDELPGDPGSKNRGPAESLSLDPPANPRKDQDLSPAPRLKPVKMESFETPSLSSASSATLDTRASQQLVTPENAPAQLTRQATDATDVASNFGNTPSGSAGKGKKQRRPTIKEEVESFETQSKRDAFLERNRVAATKCRQKKKEWVSDLEETKLGLENVNSHLQMEYNGLLDEVSRIRAQLITHAHCNDPNINKWVENEAKRFVLSQSDRYDQMLATMGQPAALATRQGSVASSTGYGPDMVSPVTAHSQHGSMSLPPGTIPTSPAFFQPNVAPASHPPIPIEHPFPPGPERGPSTVDGTDYDGMSIL